MQSSTWSHAVRRWGAVAVATTIIVASAGMVGVAYAAEEEIAVAETQPAGPRGRFGPGADVAGADGPLGGHIRDLARRAAKAMAVQGEVTAIGDGTLTVEFQRHTPRLGDDVTHTATLTLDDASILLDAGFAPLDAAAIEVGDAVVVVPRLVWGEPVVALLYQGAVDDLLDAVYMGELTAIDGDTLTLTNAATEEEVTVVTDDATIWVDGGELGRPAELAEGLRVRILGVEEDGVVRAVVITPALLQF
jgi:hypothetical protein